MPKHYRPPGKKKEGNAVKYMTRTQAVKKINVTLHDFRRLCILKGIFPREPKKKFKGTHQTYYHTKDILFLKHEPLVEKFREQKVHDRKVKKAMSKKNRDLAQRLMTRKPDYSLDRIILERYPRFIDAFGDLDDCLSMAEILGQKITWVTPHALQQVISDDVDFSVMLVFLEFYEASFVNFKLYHSIQVEYPPILDPRLEALAADLYALSRLLDAKSAHKTLQLTSGSENDKPETGDGKPDESELRLAQLQHQLPSNESGGFMHQDRDSDDEDDEDEDTKECKALFKNEVLLESGGSERIVDRPTVDRKFLSRAYVQPQWGFDCVNARIILPTEEYCVGRVPPPHLSPFVDNEAEGYLPEYAAKIKQLQAAARKQVLPMPGTGREDLYDPENLLAEGVLSRKEDIEAEERKKKMKALEKEYHEELKMELQGMRYNASKPLIQSSNPVAETTDQAPPVSSEDPEEIMAKTTMSRKKRGLYEAIKNNKKRKQDAVELLKSRKKKHLESQKSGRTTKLGVRSTRKRDETMKMEARKLLNDKKFWFASFLIAWAAALQGHMMWVQKQDSFKQKFGDPKPNPSDTNQ
ncbi:Pescadillo-like protein [Drosera capensis]